MGVGMMGWVLLDLTVGWVPHSTPGEATPAVAGAFVQSVWSFEAE